MRQRKHPEIIYTTKVCSKCGIEKPLSEFNKSSREIRGVVPSCKKCCCRLTPEKKQAERDRDDLFYNGFKKCTTCGDIKPITEFRKNGNKNSGGVFFTKNRCKACDRIYMKQYKKTEKFKRYIKKYYDLHVEDIREKTNLRNRKNSKQQYILKKQKHADNPSLMVASMLRSRIWDVLFRRNMGTEKWFKFWDVVGCSPDCLRTHLESQFKDGMTRDTHGRRGWHIDHILPCASFNLNNPEEQKKCFHYTNLQPLWWYENISKSDKIIAA
jgi:hypothetical protein